MNDLLRILCFDRMIKHDYNDEERKSLYLSAIVLCIITLVAIYLTK
jgi:uncharacterized membrane protein